MKKALIIFTMCAALGAVAPAEALTVYDPRNHVENLATKLNTVEQLQKQALQIQHELANLAKLDPMMSNKTTAEIRETMNQLISIRKSVDAIGSDYNKLMSGWDDMFPGYEKWNGCSAEQYARQVQKINNAWDKAIQQSMGSAAAASPEAQAKVATQVNDLLQSSQNAEGAMGALQANSQLTALSIMQLQKIGAMLADSMRTQNLYYEKQLDAERAAAKRKEEFFQNQSKYRNSKLENNGAQFGHFKR